LFDICFEAVSKDYIHYVRSLLSYICKVYVYIVFNTPAEEVETPRGKVSMNNRLSSKINF